MRRANLKDNTNTYRKTGNLIDYFILIKYSIKWRSPNHFLDLNPKQCNVIRKVRKLEYDYKGINFFTVNRSPTVFLWGKLSTYQSRFFSCSLSGKERKIAYVGFFARLFLQVIRLILGKPDVISLVHSPGHLSLEE